ncbi:MAG: cobalamin-dependent protein, partial [Vicinamibacteria bacterium]
MAPRPQRKRVLLLSCYELGHQPLGLAFPLAFLERAGFEPRAIDLAVEPLDDEAVRAADFIGVSVPMHTALRLALDLIPRIRALNPSAHLCFYGLYATLNVDLLLASGVNSVLSGEHEDALAELASRAG